jgi:hypothetical protein
MNSLWNRMMRDHFDYRPRYTLLESINESKRPEEGLTRPITEARTVRVKCVYPDPDDGVSYSWVKVEEEDGNK